MRPSNRSEPRQNRFGASPEPRHRANRGARTPAGVAIRPAGRALEQAALHEERLVHVLDGLGRLAHRDRQRAEPDRPAHEGAAQRVEDRPVDLVEAELVDLEQRERVARRRRR